MHLATRGKSTDGDDPAGRPISKTVPQTGVTGSFVDPTVPTPTIPYWTGKGHGAIPESSVPVYTVGLTQRYIDDHPRPFHRLVGPGSYLSPYDRRPRDEDLPVEDGRIVWPADYASNIDSLEYRTIGTVGYDRSLKGKTLCIFSYLVYDEMSGTRGFNLGLEPDNVSIRIINGCVVRFCSIAFVRGVTAFSSHRSTATSRPPSRTAPSNPRHAAKSSSPPTLPRVPSPSKASARSSIPALHASPATLRGPVCRRSKSSASARLQPCSAPDERAAPGQGV